MLSDIGRIQIYHKYAPDGTIKIYKKDDIVLYQDRLFQLKNVKGTSSGIDLTPPSVSSPYWSEISTPQRLLTSTTTPTGIKFLGDRWFNPENAITYTYVKLNNKYEWISG